MTDTTDTTAAPTDAPTDPAASADHDDVAAAIAAMAPDILERLNVDFEDAVLFIGRVLGERPEATAARVLVVDPAGADLVVTDPHGDHLRRLDFPEPVTAPMQLTDALFGLLAGARERSGEDELTTAELEMQEVASLRTFLTQVVAVGDVHPHLRRITFGGGDLATFTPAGPDTFLYLLLPPPGRTELTIDQSFTWTGYDEMPESERPVGAYYTLRHWRPEQQELDILCVLHGDAGPASSWAARARPGDPVALWGPRTAYAPPSGTDRYLLVADETGLPAVAVILETLPAGMPAQVVAEVDSPDERQELPCAPSIDVTWVYREGRPPGTTTLLADAVRALPWPGGALYVWGGGESRSMTAVRNYVRRERGLDRTAVSLVAYWRHAAHADDPDDADGSDE
jgi:NADPH-dependent ferric siderophore reductase